MWLNTPLFIEIMTSDFLAFALLISGDESQSKAQYDLQSIG